MIHKLKALSAASAVAAIAALLSCGVAVATTPGSLDSTFGGSGVVPLASGTLALGVTVQSDGQVIVVGTAGGRLLVERLSASGSPTASYSGPSGYARGVAIAPGGKIVVSGTSGGSMFVERLTPALAPDPTFGSGGIASAFAGQGAVANGVAVASDGSVAAAGTVGSSTAVARFSSGGAVAWTQSGFGGTAGLNGVAIQPDGKVIVVGVQFQSRFTNGLIARLTSTGALDSTFENHGAFTYSAPNTGYTSLTAVKIQIDGRIVAAGVAETPDAVVVRLNRDGSFDTGFGSGGTAEQPSGEEVLVPEYPTGAYGVGIAGGGRVVAAGNFAVTGTEVDEALYAFTPAGAPEPSFTGGVGTQSPTPGTVRGPTGADEACALAIAPDGSLVTVGDAVTSLPDTAPCSANDTNGYVARYVGFGPPPAGGPPVVSTGAVSGISATSATLAGQVNPNGLSTGYHFEYGPTTAYGSSTADTVVNAGSAAASATATLTGLAPGTTYHYRLDAGNLQGTSSGTDGTFTTAGGVGPPTAVTGKAKPAELGATISGQVNPGNQQTTYRVQFGKSRKYGSSSATSKLAPAGSTENITVRLTKLKPLTTYHFRLVASNASGARNGSDRTFKTLPLLKASVTKLARSYTIKEVSAGRLTAQIACNQACSAKGTLLVTAGTARTLRLGTRALAIGSGRALLRRSGTRSFVVRLTKTAERALANRHGVPAIVRIVIKPVGPGRTVTSTRGLKLTR